MKVAFHPLMKEEGAAGGAVADPAVVPAAKETPAVPAGGAVADPAVVPAAKETPAVPAADVVPAAEETPAVPAGDKPLKTAFAPDPKAAEPKADDPAPVELTEDAFVKAVGVDDKFKGVFDPNVVKQLFPAVKEAGINPAQFGKIAVAFMTLQQQQQAEASKIMNDQAEKFWNDSLKQFNEEQRTEARRAFDVLLPAGPENDEIRFLFESTALGAHPAIVGIFTKMAKFCRDDVTPVGSAAGSAVGPGAEFDDVLKGVNGKK